MNSLLIVIAASFLLQVCASATVENAETKLKELRELTNKELNEAFVEHSKMSTEIDSVAENTKTYGLEEIAKKTEKYLAKLRADKALTQRCRGTRDNIYQHLQKFHSDELIKCVDEIGSQSVKVLSTQRMALVEYMWDAVYRDEKEIIVCGTDARCLDAAVANVQDQINEVTKVIRDEVNISKHNAEIQVQLIKGCASRSVADVEHDLGKVPTCIY